MEAPTTVYVKLDTDKEVRVEMTHVTEAFPTPHEENRERALSKTEINRVIQQLMYGQYSTQPIF